MGCGIRREVLENRKRKFNGKRIPGKMKKACSLIYQKSPPEMMESIMYNICEDVRVCM